MWKLHLHFGHGRKRKIWRLLQEDIEERETFKGSKEGIRNTLRALCPKIMVKKLLETWIEIFFHPLQFLIDNEL